jgi:hypothetical protein
VSPLNSLSRPMPTIATRRAARVFTFRRLVLQASGERLG